MTIVAGAAVGEAGCVCLDHCIDGSYGYPGCIYTENLNRKDFTDNNTVIYGHNMKNDSMPVKQ